MYFNESVMYKKMQCNSIIYAFGILIFKIYTEWYRNPREWEAPGVMVDDNFLSSGSWLFCGLVLILVTLTSDRKSNFQ